MYYLRTLFILLAVTASSLAVSVNVEATLGLGKEVVDYITDFLGMSIKNSRRSLLPTLEEDSITSLVRLAIICPDTESCQSYKTYVEELLIIFGKNIESILSKAFGSNFKPVVYENHLIFYLEVIKGLILHKKGNNVNDWVDTVKKITTKFQELASIYVNEIDVNPKNKNKEKKDLNHKVILATIIIENNYLNILCTDYDLCIKSFKVTRALQTIFSVLNSKPEAKVKSFVRVFYKALYETSFYFHIEEAVGHKLQVLLNDMAYSNDTPAKDVLITVQKIVEERLGFIETRRTERMAHDSRLIHSILSDMDYIFHNEGSESFDNFFQVFNNWSQVDIQLDNSMRQVLLDIKKQLSTIDNDIFTKLVNEVRTFLDLTINT